MGESKMVLLSGNEIIGHKELNACLETGGKHLQRIKAGEEKYKNDLGWLEIDKWAGKAQIAQLQATAREICAKADVLVLVGIGGSNQAARAAINAVRPSGGIKVLYAGNTLSAAEFAQTLKQIEGKRFCINVIAKNFETLEPGLTFRLLRQELKKRHKGEAHKYIYTTVTQGSYFEEISLKEKYSVLFFPSDMGGRYSVLSDVGLLPMAVAGVDIKELVRGAQDMREEIFTTQGKENPALLYASVRNVLEQKGYRMEMFAFFEPCLRYFGRWWTQLFAESEGKEDKGLYPVLGEYTEDLHSIGQFVQQGTPVLFETFLTVEEKDVNIPIASDKLEDKFSYLDGSDMWSVNNIAQNATIQAHNARLPCLKLSVPKLNEYHIGQLFYFNMFACYLSGSILGINPFNQDGVEAYKELMFKNLGK